MYVYPMDCTGRIAQQYKVKVESNKSIIKNYPVGLRKTVKNREDKLGVPVGIVGQEHTHRVHEHLVQAAREHGLGKFPEVFL